MRSCSFNQTILLNLFILIPRLQPGIFEELAKKTLWQQHMLRLQWLKSRHIEYYFIFTSEPTPIQNFFSKGGRDEDNKGWRDVVKILETLHVNSRWKRICIWKKPKRPMGHIAHLRIEWLLFFIWRNFTQGCFMPIWLKSVQSF